MLGTCRREYGYGCIPFVVIILFLLGCKLLPNREHEIRSLTRQNAYSRTGKNIMHIMFSMSVAVVAATA